MSHEWMPLTTSRTSPVIKVKARVILRRGSEILLEERIDVDGNVFVRPIGGNVEFGETTRDAATREFLEETGLHVRNLALLGWLEDIRHAVSGTTHDISVIYEGECEDALLDDVAAIDCQEGDKHFTARWFAIELLTQSKDGINGIPFDVRPANLLSIL